LAEGREFRIEAPAGTIVGWRAGSGPQALVLHGGPGLSDYTEGLAAELADVFETIRYQQRGLAPTTIDAPFTVEAHVEDALAVLNGLEVERAVVVGHSWGGHLAMHLAVAAWERVSAGVIVDPLGAVPDGGEQELEETIMARLPTHLARRVEALERRIAAGDGGEADADKSNRIMWPYYFARPENAPPMPELRMNLQTFADTQASVHEHFGRETLTKGLRDLDCPLLFVHGRESPIPWRRSAESARLAPDGMLDIVDDCGHFLWIEAPGSVRAAVERAGLVAGGA
jgi:proline iminopeptidase